MSEYISQSELLDAAKQGWDTYAGKLGLELPELLGYRTYQPDWTNDVLDVDSPNGTRAELESIWVYADESGTEGIDGIQDVTLSSGYTGTYRCKSGGNTFGGFRMQTAIAKTSQVAWRNFSVIQMTEAITTLNVKIFPPLAVNFPVFTNYQDGYDFSYAMYNYLEDPTDEKFQLAKTALAKSINPVGQKSKDPNIDKDSRPTNDEIPVGDERRGGTGNHNYSTDVIGLPTLPTLTATSTGFVTLYRVSEAILRTLADKLFTDTWAGAWDNFWQNADEAIAGLSIVPFQPPVSGRAKPRVGMYTLDVAMDVISSQYVEVDCGEIEVEEFYGSAFDYSPYTKISIYLPYVGVRSLDVDEVMNRRIGVKYYCDAYSGSCMAVIYVRVDPETGDRGNEITVKYTFSGNIAQQVPTAAASWDRMIQSGIALACVALPAIAAGGAAIQSAGYGAGASIAAMQGSSAMGAGFATRSVLTHAAAGASESWAASGSAQMALALDGATMATAMSAKPTVERTGSLGSGVGFLGPQKPFLIIEIPRQSIPTDYMEFHGYPSNESATLGDLEGYVQVEDIHLTEVYATGPEKDEIMKMLKEGVIL